MVKTTSYITLTLNRNQLMREWILWLLISQHGFSVSTADIKIGRGSQDLLGCG